MQKGVKQDMPRIELVKGKYRNKHAIRNLIRYAINSSKTPHGIIGVLGAPYRKNADDIIDYFNQIQHFYKQRKGRLAYHFLIEFSPNEQKLISFKDYMEIGYQIGSFFDNECYQTVFGLHENTDNLHFHIVVNSVNYSTGKKYRLTKKKLKMFKEWVEETTLEYLPPSFLTNPV